MLEMVLSTPLQIKGNFNNKFTVSRFKFVCTNHGKSKNTKKTANPEIQFNKFFENLITLKRSRY